MKNVENKIKELYANVHKGVDDSTQSVHNELSEEKPWNSVVSGYNPDYKMSDEGFEKLMQSVVSALSERELKQLISELKQHVNNR